MLQTAPVHEIVINDAGIDFEVDTQNIIKEFAGVDRVVMMLADQKGFVEAVNITFGCNTFAELA